MLPLAGSDSAIPGYNEWLNEVSQLHIDSKKWGGTVAWLHVHWKHYFHQGLSPIDALRLESARQTETRAQDGITNASVIREKLATT